MDTPVTSVPVEIDRPAVGGAVTRPRLHTLLDTPQPQLCVLRAASGAGKTTLLHGWSASRSDPAPLLWVTISAPVVSAAAFWSHVIDASRRSGLVRAPTAATLEEQVVRSQDPARVVIDFLAGAGPVIIVLDAYEKVGEAIETIDKDLLRLTDALPQLRVIVAARGGTTLADDPHLLRGRVQLIADADLAFTADEASDLLRTQLDRDDPTLAAGAVRATGGYALGLRALVLALAHSATASPVGSDAWRQLVATDLRAGLADEAVARFVALTSVPPYFDAALAGQITGRTNAAEVLRVLEWQGFGRWIPYARSRPVFQYVDAIRDVFSTEIRRTDEAAYLRAASLAALWLFGSDDSEGAFDLALQARDYPLAVRIYLNLLRVNPECYLTDRLIGPLSAIPVRELRRHPMLSFALGLARLAHPVLRATAPEAFRMAVAAASPGESNGSGLDDLVNKSVRAVGLRLLGRFADAARSSSAAIAEIDGLSPERQDQLRELLAMILRQLSFSLLQGGSYDAAITAVSRSAALTRVSSTRNCAFAYATGTRAYVGELAAARAARDQISDGWPPETQLSYLNAMTVIGEGLMDLDAMEFTCALGRVLSTEAFTAQTEFWGWFTLVAVQAQVGLGQGLSAARHVEARLADVVPPLGLGDNTVTRALRNVQAIGWLCGGRIAKAEHALAAVPARAPEGVPGRLLHLILTDRSDAAVLRLPRWLALPRHTIRSRAASLMLGAVATARAGDDGPALALASRAHDLSATHGVRAHLMFVPAADRMHLAEIAARAGKEDTAAHLRSVELDVVPSSVPQMTLGHRERAVLAELIATASREQIAAHLGVSPNTVKSQLRSIYHKLGVTSREAALAVASEYELLEPQDAR